MAYKAAIFDLDGTLVHTNPDYRYDLANKVLKELGTKSPGNQYIDRLWFESGRDELLKKHFKLVPFIFWSIYREYDTSEQRSRHVRLYDDVDFIQELREKGYKTGIVTGAPAEIAALEIRLLGKENFNAVVIANSSNGVKHKPHPEGLDMCLDLLNIKKKHAVFIGNSDEDIEAAKNAGIFDILVKRGEHEFPNINPSLAVHSLYELRHILK